MIYRVVIKSSHGPSAFRGLYVLKKKEIIHYVAKHQNQLPTFYWLYMKNLKIMEDCSINHQSGLQRNTIIKYSFNTTKFATNYVISFGA